MLSKWSAAAGAAPGRYFIALVLVSTAAYLPLAAFFQPWDLKQFGPFAFQPGRLLHYFVYFFASGAVTTGLMQYPTPWLAAFIIAMVLIAFITSIVLEYKGYRYDGYRAAHGYTIADSSAYDEQYSSWTSPCGAARRICA